MVTQFKFLTTSLTSVAMLIFFAAPHVAYSQPKAAPPPAKPADVQLAVEKGLFFVEHQSMRWWKNRKCATCHDGQMLLVAANVAKSQGVPVDREKLDFWTERWVITDALVDYTDGRLNGLGIPTAPFVLLHRDLDRDPSETRAQMWAQVLRIAFQSQGADGSWTPKAAIVDITPRMRNRSIRYLSSLRSANEFNNSIRKPSEDRLITFSSVTQMRGSSHRRMRFSERTAIGRKQ